MEESGLCDQHLVWFCWYLIVAWRMVGMWVRFVWYVYVVTDKLRGRATLSQRITPHQASRLAQRHIPKSPHESTPPPRARGGRSETKERRSSRS